MKKQTRLTEDELAEAVRSLELMLRVTGAVELVVSKILERENHE